jgi:hypothetical protein
MMRAYAVGMFIAVAGAARGAPANQPPTFYKDVLPILQARCQACHRPGEAAPFSMLEYREVRPWARAIKDAVLTRNMPPWFAAREIGRFQNNPSLTATETQTLTSWVDRGAIAGDPKDAPPLLRFVTGWTIGKPDAVFEVPNEFPVPARGTIDYQWILVPTGYTEDKWLRAVEVRPGDSRVVHHIAVYYRLPGSNWLQDAKPGIPVPKMSDASEGGMSDGAIGGYSPGSAPFDLAPGRAILLPKGADLVFQIHYTPNGLPTTDRSKVGFIFAKERPKETVTKVAVATHDFVIQPGEADTRVDAQVTLKTDLRFLDLTPHMHLRGRSFEIRAVFPDGAIETLLRVDRYKFDWQTSYVLSPERVLPKGTRIEATAHFDNSPNNRLNPDPLARVVWGDQIWDEMMVALMTVVIPVDRDPRSLLQYGPYLPPQGKPQTP